MDTKIVFHILTAICAGIIVIVTTASSSQNKTVIVCVLVTIGIILEIAIPFLKTKTPPHLTYSLKLLDSNYSSGVEVDGIKWEKGFKRYSFELQAKAGTVDASNVRLSFVFPSGIVTYKILSTIGCEDWSFPTRSTSFHHISKEGSMTDQVPFYQNIFYINVLKLLPKAYLKIHLILTYPFDQVLGSKKYGIFDIEYRYMDSSEKDVDVKRKFAMHFYNITTKELKINTTEEAGPEHKFYHLMIPKIGIKVPFEQGRGIKLHMLPSRLKEQIDDSNEK